jgi:hypothetical protein
MIPAEPTRREGEPLLDSRAGISTTVAVFEIPRMEALEFTRVAAAFAVALASWLLVGCTTQWGDNPVYRSSDLDGLALRWLATMIVIVWLTLGAARLQ